MVYLQPAEIGWRPLYESWKNTLPSYFDDNEEEQQNAQMLNIEELVEIVVQPMINYVRSECRETTATNDQSIVQAFLRLWGTLLKHFDDASFTEDLDKRAATAQVDNMFLFAAIWSLCITCDSEFRRPIDMYLKKILEGSLEDLPKFPGNKKILPSKFDRGLIYDYFYDVKGAEWKHWMADVNKDEIDNFARDAQP
jgi:dynein heavy chain